MEITYDKERKTWTARWRVTDPLTGKVTYKKKRGFLTKREAKDYLDLRADQKPFLFSSLVEDYIQSRKGIANEETIESIRNRFKAYCEPFFRKDVQDIDKKFLNAWRSKIVDLELSTTTKNRILQQMRSISKYGFDNYDLPDFAKSLKNMSKKSTDIKPMRVMPYEDFEKAMDCCENNLYKAFYIFLYHTGVRKGEARAILKQNIKGNTVLLDKSLRRESGNFGTMKTPESKRTITLDNYVMDAIKPLMNEEGDFLFGGLVPLPLTSIERNFRNACDKAGVNRVRIHDLRHSFASNALLNGGNVLAVASYLGHKSPQTTMNVYAHTMRDSQQKLLDALDKVYK